MAAVAGWRLGRVTKRRPDVGCLPQLFNHINTRQAVKQSVACVPGTDSYAHGFKCHDHKNGDNLQVDYLS